MRKVKTMNLGGGKARSLNENRKRSAQFKARKSNTRTLNECVCKGKRPRRMFEEGNMNAEEKMRACKMWKGAIASDKTPDHLRVAATNNYAEHGCEDMVG